MAEYFDLEVFAVKALVVGDMFEGFWPGESRHGFENSS